MCVFQFLGKKLLEIKKCLLNLLEITLPFCKLKLFLKLPAKAPIQFPFNDLRPKNLWTDIVYIFKSNSCNAIYYRKRECYFYVRAAKHVGLSHFTNKRVNDVKQSVVSGHLLTCDCNINVNDFTILSKDFLRIFTTIGKSSFM